jgi:hypothetical protein
MTAAEFTVELFCRVDDALLETDPHLRRHPQARLHPSEVVTIGMVFALRGGTERAFYRWFKKELGHLFPGLPERTRLFRLFTRFAPLSRRFLAHATVLGVCDCYGIELIHPVREGRSHNQIGGKGKSNHRWIVGAKCFVMCNSLGQIVDIIAGSASLHDTIFHCVIENVENDMVVLADGGFHAKDGDPKNLKICKRGTWNDRMIIETLNSLFTTVLKMKKLTNRTWSSLDARLSFVSAAFNLCTAWTGEVILELADFAL